MKTLAQIRQEQKAVKKIIFFTTLIVILLSIMAQGCQETCDIPTYISYEPVYAPINEVRVTADYISPQELDAPGKIYFKDNHIFISEINKGIHVINNTNPSNPIKIGFINLPGNKDLAAKGDFLYADNYMDLVILDISDKSNIMEVNRLENVFDQYYYIDSEMGVMIDYNVVEREYDVACGEDMRFTDSWGREFDVSLSSTQASSAGAGIGGSMARFTIASDYLYTINEYQMKLFDIKTLDSPIQGNTIDLGWGIETIFPYQGNLFLGAQSGMHIYDNSNPALPTHLSTYEHINACDPVAVQGQYAYVTLRSGTECQNFTNQLDVIDISDLSNPSLVISHQMLNPHGLGLNGDCLFIAEGDQGLKLYNANDPLKIHENLIKHHKNVNAFDVIPLDGTLLMVGEDGFYQYAYDCQDKLQLLSNIKF
ncbi:hypothetical protein N6H18_07470 [Reichenbachiella agarivorans]|uniref:LVIVD repeat-containing protein n=1 Tax=Reichenbachiella agarivorans TaxID=2979464 RepID=A0ABY6CTD8_9BACT|nr:hypothetical protein [Reichenbachiella agarivorans]UXP33786.1 hypothetical protein N6H18_07470 [Reichenbachiella agarivorans]